MSLIEGRLKCPEARSEYLRNCTTGGLLESNLLLLVTYAKWINDGETSSGRHDVGRSRIIKEKGRPRMSRLVKQN